MCEVRAHGLLTVAGRSAKDDAGDPVRRSGVQRCGDVTGDAERDRHIRLAEALLHHFRVLATFERKRRPRVRLLTDLDVTT